MGNLNHFDHNTLSYIVHSLLQQILAFEELYHLIKLMYFTSNVSHNSVGPVFKFQHDGQTSLNSALRKKNGAVSESINGFPLAYGI
jgi:hypothetical protein